MSDSSGILASELLIDLKTKFPIFFNAPHSMVVMGGEIHFYKKNGKCPRVLLGRILPSNPKEILCFRLSVAAKDNDKGFIDENFGYHLKSLGFKLQYE